MVGLRDLLVLALHEGDSYRRFLMFLKFPVENRVMILKEFGYVRSGFLHLGV